MMKLAIFNEYILFIFKQAPSYTVQTIYEGVLFMKISNGVKIAAVYGSVFLGAGFASGQELLQYFVSFGSIGLLGILVAGFLFAMVGYATLKICVNAGINNYSQLMVHLLGKRMGPIMEGLVAGFLFCLFVAMLAGAGATGREAFNIPFTFGAILVSIIVFFILCFGLKGIVKINIILAPFMLLGGIFIGLLTFFTYTTPVFSSFLGGRFAFAWLLSAVVYASYNLVTAVPILTATSSLVEKKKDGVVGGILGGGVITILGICMALPLFLYYSNVVNLEIPFLHIVFGYGTALRFLYLGVLGSALLTTAACNAFAVLEWLKSRGFNNKIKTAGVICLTGVAAAHIGFSNIVIFVYPLFGFLGLFKIVVILFGGFWYNEKD